MPSGSRRYFSPENTITRMKEIEGKKLETRKKNENGNLSKKQ